MPASANCPDSTLISPILTVPCACADGAPNSSATAQPSPRTLRSIAHPPGLSCRRPFVAKSVLTKNYAVESILSGSVRGASAAPPVLGDRPSGDAPTGVPASASAQPKQAELLASRCWLGRESPAGRQGFAHGRPRQQRCRRQPQPGKCR